MSELLSAAVRNNADWCALVCRVNGVASTMEGPVWRAAGPTPPFYPAAITLQPSATAADVRDAGGGVKDSFAAVDLSDAGFTELFTAHWIHRPADGATPTDRVVGGAAGTMRVADGAGLVAWAAAWGEQGAEIFGPALLDDPDVAIIATAAGGGAILHRSGAVVGVSNLFTPDGTDAGDTWAAVVGAAGAHFPGRDLVGYESGDDLAVARRAGFTALGPLRVWVRS